MDPQRAEELGGMQGDALKNFSTSQDTLSLFCIDEVVTAERVAAVIALGRDFLDHADFAIFDDSVLHELGLQFKKTAGETPDRLVNDRHIDVIHLTAEQVLQLAAFIQREGTLSRITAKRLQPLLKELLRGPDIDNNRVNNKLLSKLVADDPRVS